MPPQQRGQRAYVHCWGGIGRTGTLVGCYLVRRGMAGSDAIVELARLRAGTPDARYAAPARECQRQLILQWPQPALSSHPGEVVGDLQAGADKVVD